MLNLTSGVNINCHLLIAGFSFSALARLKSQSRKGFVEVLYSRRVHTFYRPVIEPIPRNCKQRFRNRPPRYSLILCGVGYAVIISSVRASDIINAEAHTREIRPRRRKMDMRPLLFFFPSAEMGHEEPRHIRSSPPPSPT